jgi:hypothetical protein
MLITLTSRVFSLQDRRLDTALLGAGAEKEAKVLHSGCILLEVTKSRTYVSLSDSNSESSLVAKERF